jgi:hypothetical protein
MRGRNGWAVRQVAEGANIGRKAGSLIKEYRQA